MSGIKKAYLGLFVSYAAVAEGLAKLATLLCYLLLVAVTAIAGLAVFARYVLNSPISWTEEIARYILIWLTMLGASVAIKQRSHISLDSLISRVPKRVATILEILVFGIVVALLIIVDKHSFVMVVTQSVRRFAPSTEISMVWPQASLPVGFTLILFQSLYIVLEDIKELLTGKPSQRPPASAGRE